MPNNDVIRLDRSYLTAKVDLGGGETLDVVATHFHAGDEDSPIRVPQARAVLDAIDSDRTTVLIGDLNAHPDHPEMLLMSAVGLPSTPSPPPERTGTASPIPQTPPGNASTTSGPAPT